MIGRHRLGRRGGNHSNQGSVHAHLVAIRQGPKKLDYAWIAATQGSFINASADMCHEASLLW